MMPLPLSPYVKIPTEQLVEPRRLQHPLMKFKGSWDSFSRRIVIQTCETQGFESVVEAIEEAGGKKKKNAGVNKNMLAHYGALFKNGMSDIAIKDVPKEDTVLLLNYMYKGRMEIENGATLRKALTHAIRFGMGSLVDEIDKLYDFQHHSAILLYNIGEELGISRYETKVVDALGECICSPKFPSQLLASIPSSLLCRVLERGMVAESESEIFDLILRYLAAAKVPTEEACEVLNELHYPQLCLSEIHRIKEFLANAGVETARVPNLQRIMQVDDIIGNKIPTGQLTKRGLSPRAYMLWMERRYPANKSVLILNGVRLNREEKAHAYAKLKLSATIDKLELPENFEMVTIGGTMYVSLKDEVFPSTNVNIQGFTVTDDHNILRPNNTRIPLSFKQEIRNKRLTVDGSRLVLSFTIMEKKNKEKYRLGYFEALPELNRTFNEVEIPEGITDIVCATLSKGRILILTRTSFVVVDQHKKVSRHSIALYDLQVNCVDLIAKGDLVMIYALCHSQTPFYKQRDIIQVFDLRENKFLSSPSGEPRTCDLAEISSLFEKQYSKRFKRGMSRDWHARDSTVVSKVKPEESLFRFYDVGGQTKFVWTDTFNESGKIFHFGTFDVETMSAAILRKVFYVKSDDSGTVTLSRDLTGLLPGYLLQNESNTWLESKLCQMAKLLTPANLCEFQQLLAFT